MEKFRLLSISIIIMLVASSALLADTQSMITDAFDRHYKRENITVKTIYDGSTLKKLMIKIKNPSVGAITADYVTVTYDFPKLDWTKLKKKHFSVKKHSGMNVNVLISESGIKNYLYAKANYYKKKGFSVSVAFKPPFVECQYNMPANQLSGGTAQTLSKYIPGDSFQGYAAFKLHVKNNLLSATSEKVILNHFLLPNFILTKLQSRFNPFDSVRPIAPLNYQLNKLTVQAKYIQMSN